MLNINDKMKSKIIEKLQKENDNLKQQLGMYQISLAQIMLDKRDMFLGPGDFVYSSSMENWKKIKITLNGEDISKNVSKIIFYGPRMI